MSVTRLSFEQWCAKTVYLILSALGRRVDNVSAPDNLKQGVTVIGLQCNYHGGGSVNVNAALFKFKFIMLAVKSTNTGWGQVPLSEKSKTKCLDKNLSWTLEFRLKSELRLDFCLTL